MSVDPMLRYQGDFVPTLQVDLDLAAIQMGADERFLFSRIDGFTAVRELASLMGTSPMTVARALLRLEAQHVIERPAEMPALSDEEIAAVVQSNDSADDEATTTQAAKRVKMIHEADLIGVGRYAGFVFPREPLEEVNDLPMALRKELIWCDRHTEANAYVLFDVSARLDAKQIRKMVNNKLKLFHPDTYFEYDLGSFGPIILRHSARLGKLAEIMLNDAARDELKARLIAEGTLKEELDASTANERSRVAAAMKKRRLKKNPMFRRIAQAKEIYAEAMAHAEQKKYVKAYNSMLTACTFDPANPVYKEMEERFKRRAFDERAERFVKAAEFNEGVGRWDRAAAGWIHAARSATHRPEYWAKAGAMLLRVGEDLKMAAEMVDRAVEEDPDNPAFLRIQLDIFDAAEMHAKSARVAERILELDPTAADVAERLKKARRSS